MSVRGIVMRAFRSVFREQKIRLQIDWLTHTDELILHELADGMAANPVDIAESIDRSTEYIADRCRQLAIRGLLDELEPGRATDRQYLLTDLGERYIHGNIDAEELDAIGGE